MKQSKISLYDIIVVGLMAAMVFVCTMFLKLGPIPTPAGPTMLKTGNLICLLAGILFGKWRGGLAAGIGSALYDLTDPAFVASAPFTFVFFFAMAFVCGLLAEHGAKTEHTAKWNAIGAVSGACTYLVLHLGKSMIVLLLAGSTFGAAAVSCGVKFITSGINALFAVICAIFLAPMLKTALTRAGVYKKLAK